MVVADGHSLPEDDYWRLLEEFGGRTTMSFAIASASTQTAELAGWAWARGALMIGIELPNVTRSEDALWQPTPTDGGREGLDGR